MTAAIPLEYWRSFFDTSHPMYIARLEKKKAEGKTITPPEPEITQRLIRASSETTIDELKELFMEMLAKASTTDQRKSIHPKFIIILQSLSSDELKVLKFFIENEKDFFKSGNCIPAVKLRKKGNKGFTYVDAKSIIDLLLQSDKITLDLSEMTYHYIENLCSLGILNKTDIIYCYCFKEYSDIEVLLSKSHGFDVKVQGSRDFYETIPQDSKYKFERKAIIVSKLGELFAQSLAE